MFVDISMNDLYKNVKIDDNETFEDSMVECACGCGTLIPKFDKRGIERRYFCGHNRKGITGIKFTEEHKRKIGVSNKGKNKGRKVSEETRKRIGIASRGRIFTEEHKRKIGDAQTGENNHNFGKKATEETRKKISEAGKGREMSKATRKKLSDGNKGKIVSEETRRKISEANKGRKVSEETRKKMCAASMGRKHTEESLEKMSGENCVHWKGGISFEPYCPKFTNKFKEMIREAFGRKCFLCNKTEADNGQNLSVHHVQYEKNCGCDDTLKCDYVPLCKSCHGKTNNKREYWEKIIILMLNNN